MPLPSVPSTLSRDLEISSKLGMRDPLAKMSRVAMVENVVATSLTSSLEFSGERFAPKSCSQPIFVRFPSRPTTWRKIMNTKLWPRYLPGST